MEDSKIAVEVQKNAKIAAEVRKDPKIAARRCKKIQKISVLYKTVTNGAASSQVGDDDCLLHYDMASEN